MSYRIPIGTEVFPYSSESGEVAIGRLTTVELEPEDTALAVDARSRAAYYINVRPAS